MSLFQSLKFDFLWCQFWCGNPYRVGFNANFSNPNFGFKTKENDISPK